jgi:hypothetical protein
MPQRYLPVNSTERICNIAEPGEAISNISRQGTTIMQESAARFNRYARGSAMPGSENPRAWQKTYVFQVSFLALQPAR